MQATGDKAVIQWPPEGDLHRFGRPRRRDREHPVARVDVAAFFAADLVPLLRAGSEGVSARVRETAVDYEPEWLTRSQRVASIPVAGQAPLDAGRVDRKSTRLNSS